MIVRRNTFMFNCSNKGDIPMTLEKCIKCKMQKGCSLYDQMRKMASQLEMDTKEEKMYGLHNKQPYPALS